MAHRLDDLGWIRTDREAVSGVSFLKRRGWGVTAWLAILKVLDERTGEQSSGQTLWKAHPCGCKVIPLKKINQIKEFLLNVADFRR